MLTQERLKTLLDYDAETGVFRWRASGKEAGCRRKDGYVLIGVDYKVRLRHRLAWLYMTGEEPPAGIDHENGIKGDDRWSNLRAASHQQNMANVRKPAHNKSGAKGVHWHPQSKRWRVRIGGGKSREHIGLFTSVDEAAQAYSEAAARKYGPFARTT